MRLFAPGIMAGFNLMTVVTNEWNDEPQRASRPFSLDRSGMVLGEGAWIYVLEEYERRQRTRRERSMLRLLATALPVTRIIACVCRRLAMSPRAR